jgi:hypothetical protein
MEGTLFALGQFGNPASIKPTDYTTFLKNNFGQLASVGDNTTRWPCSIRPHFQPIMLSARSSQVPLSFVPLDARSKPPSKLGYLFGLIAAPTLPPAVGNLISAAVMLASFWSCYDPHTHRKSRSSSPSLPIFLFLMEHGRSTHRRLRSAKFLSQLWTSMAATGTPGDGAGILGGPWPQYNVNECNGLLISNV